MARPLSLAELVYQSRHALVGTPVSFEALWETVGRRQRIVTYTRLQVERPLDGRPPAASELTLRTLGGQVGDIGQIVPGEAALRRGATAALFLEELSPAVFAVSGMAQGHYPLQADRQGLRRLHADLQAAEQAAFADAAVHRLAGRTVNEVETLVAAEVARGSR
jgi:hypothetical protein